MDSTDHGLLADLQGLELLTPVPHAPGDPVRLWVPRQPTVFLPPARPRAVVTPTPPPAPAEPAVPSRPRSRPTGTRDLWKAARGIPARPVRRRDLWKSAHAHQARSRDLWKPPPAPSLRALLPAIKSMASALLSPVRHKHGLYLDAMMTREAVLTDPGSPTMVRAFARTRLQIRDITQHVLEAVVDVLLSDDWTATSVPDEQLRAHLRSRTKEWHRSHRPVIESRLHHRPIASLSATMATPFGLTALDQMVPGSRDTEGEALAVGMWEDRRLSRVLGGLSAEGRAVVEALARYPRLTWEEAAAVAGLSPGTGERTRRRVRYLASDLARRERMRENDR
jgi:hypothetical protein